MRHYFHILWIVPLLGVTALGADDLPQPKKDLTPPAKLPEIPSPSLPPAEGSAGGMDTNNLQRLLGQLRAQREMLRTERTEAERANQAGANAQQEQMAKLRQRLSELQARLARGPSSAGSSEESGTSETGAGAPPLRSPSGRAVVDPVALAQNLFRAGDYEAALDAFRKVPLERGEGEQKVLLRADERMPIKYMMATCLRKLGRIDEAVAAYREVAASQGDEFVADCARWQLSMLDWRHNLDTQLAHLRQRNRKLDTELNAQP